MLCCVGLCCVVWCGFISCVCVVLIRVRVGVGVVPYGVRDCLLFVAMCLGALVLCFG